MHGPGQDGDGPANSSETSSTSVLWASHFKEHSYYENFQTYAKVERVI